MNTKFSVRIQSINSWSKGGRKIIIDFELLENAFCVYSEDGNKWERGVSKDQANNWMERLKTVKIDLNTKQMESSLDTMKCLGVTVGDRTYAFSWTGNHHLDGGFLNDIYNEMMNYGLEEIPAK